MPKRFFEESVAVKRPTSLQELVDWEVRVATTLCSDRAWAARFTNLMSTQVELFGDLSGCEATREAVSRGTAAVSAALGVTFPSECMRFRRSCDNHPKAMRVLCAIAKEDDSCVFNNIFHRLPPHAQEEIAQALPDKQTSRMDAASRLTELATWLLSNRSNIFNISHSHCHCEHHDRLCPVYPAPLARKDTRQDWTSLRVGPRDDSDERRPARASVAGIVCVADSSAGARRRAAHPSEATSAVWIAERVFLAENNAEDFFFTECVPSWRHKEKLADNAALTQHHRIFNITACALQCGESTRRNRYYGAGMHLRNWVYVGPDDYSQAFQSLFACVPCMPGSSYMVATLEERHEFYSDWARQRGHIIEPQSWKRLANKDICELLLTPHELERLEDWIQESIGFDGIYLCDLEQNAPSKKGRSTGGLLFPNMLTHGTLTAIKDGGTASQSITFLTSYECLQAMGFNMYHSGGFAPVSPMRRYMKQEV